MRVLEPSLTLLSKLEPSQEKELGLMADGLMASLAAAGAGPAGGLPAPAAEEDRSQYLSPSAMACTCSQPETGSWTTAASSTPLIQTTDQPKRMTMAVNKLNKTHDMVLKTGIFNICVLTQEVPSPCLSALASKAATR